MKLLVTGICGFVGSAVAAYLCEAVEEIQIIGVDNLARQGSERNLAGLHERGVKVFRGDLRCGSDLESLPAVDWVIDAAALPSVIAGVDGQTSGRRVIEHNLIGTLNLLEYCRRHRSGCILLSTSRVYSIPALAKLPLVVEDGGFVLKRFRPDHSAGPLPAGVSPAGLTEAFSTAPPVSIYGATKLASETMMLEYGAAYDFPVWVNRCGVLAGAGQFGRADQGIFSFWIDSHRKRKPLRYFGFGGSGHQVRDCLHPVDLARLIQRQIFRPGSPGEDRIFNVGGGSESAMSLLQLTRWCDRRFGPHAVASSDEERSFDLPWVVMDSARARRTWDWMPGRSMDSILEEIADYSSEKPDWLESSN